MVFGKGQHWYPDAKSINLRHSREFPLAIRTPANGLQRAMIGIKFGRMTVFGLAAHKTKDKSLYVMQVLLRGVRASDGQGYTEPEQL